MMDSKAELLLGQVWHAGTEQSRWSKAEELRIDQNQCRRLKYYYGLQRPRGFRSRRLDRISNQMGLRCWHTFDSDEVGYGPDLVPWPLFIPQ